MSTDEVICIGELLWDSLPDGLFLGGAPFNVAVHLHALGVPTSLISRVGRDRLGVEAVTRAARYGVATELIQHDDTLPTGFVSVTLDTAGCPSYEIVAPAAWDRIELLDGVLERAERARAIVFGSLAQRSPRTAGTIRRLCELDLLRVFDVNLRSPFDDPDVVRELLPRADIVKLNEQELAWLSRNFGLPVPLREAAEALVEAFDCGTVCVTRGPEGAALLREGRWSSHPGYRVEVRDTVGSGDAFLAAFVHGYLAGADDAELLRRANLRGAEVATRAGALPA